MIIAIDVGHAKGTGARGHGQEEHDLSVANADRLAVLLREQGHFVHVIDHPELSNTADFIQACKDSNALKADVFLSLHCDASDNASAHGAHCIYYSASGKKIAEAVAKPLCKLMPGRAESVQYGNFYVLKNTKAPAIIIEQGFITNADDVVKLIDGKEIVKAIAEGFKNYYESL